MPRQCGVATFTSDLTDALEIGTNDGDCIVVALNDSDGQYHYHGRVRFEISETEAASYRRAAAFLNVNAVDVVCLQHEYGIFGGSAGGYVLDWMRELRMPVVTTLHTILEQPSESQRSVMDELVRRSTRLVAMTEQSAALLQRVHSVDSTKIDVIPHGIDAAPFAVGHKDRFGVAGQTVILTFGLLSPDKGIEYVIDALPEIVAQFPNTVYVVLGATHPHVRQRHGETYRLMLENRAMRLGMQQHVRFHDRFVSPQELRECLAMADIYVTPYLNPAQTSSGTLALALGFGKAVVSTPYRYANELLANGCGELVPCRDSSAIASAMLKLLGDAQLRADVCQRAAALGQTMLWPIVADKYRESFKRAVLDATSARNGRSNVDTTTSRMSELPEVKLNHLRAMTDSTGLLQHASYDVPCYEEGYCVDDNARALLLTTFVEDYGVNRSLEIRQLSARYLAFVSYSFERSTQMFRNQMTYARTWVDEPGSEDSHARTIWALGAVIGRSGDPGRQSLAGQLFHAGLVRASDFTSPRAWAFTLLGISEYLRAFRGDTSVQLLQTRFVERLTSLYAAVATPQWRWFETNITYSNARLPQALIVVGRTRNDAELTRIGLESLRWLANVQTSNKGYFSPIGSAGFWQRGADKAHFDQQPLEASCMVSACLEAWRATGSSAWLNEARRAFFWFLGDNHLSELVYDDATGGCRDGLHEDRVNQNQGAESTLAFLLALIEMRAAEQTIFSTAKIGAS